MLTESGTSDCNEVMNALHSILGVDAGRLKNAGVATVSQSGGSATVQASLDGHTVNVDLQNVDGGWRLSTERVVHKLLGLGG
jgi:hypothetical protein